MHLKAIDNGLVAVEKIDSQDTINPRTGGATIERQIPGAHPMWARLVGANLKIFDFTSVDTFGCQPQEPIPIAFYFREWHTERSQRSWRDKSRSCACIDDKTGRSSVQFAGDVKFVTRPLER